MAGNKRKAKGSAANGETVTDDEGATSHSENEEAAPPPSQRRARPKPKPAQRAPVEEPFGDDFDLPIIHNSQDTPRPDQLPHPPAKAIHRTPLSDRNVSQQLPLEDGTDDDLYVNDTIMSTPTKRKANVVDPDVPNFKSRRKRIKL